MPETDPLKRYVVDISDDRISVGDGVSIPREWGVIIEDPELHSTVRVDAIYDGTLKRAAVRAVRVERDSDGTEVTATALRQVTVQAALQDSGLHVTTITEPGHEPETVSDYVHRVRSDGRQLEMMQLCTTLYRAAATVSVPPLKFVADELHMSVSTATRWMARARHAGLAEDLITRETYNRMQATTRDDDIRRAWDGGHDASPSGPLMGR